MRTEQARPIRLSDYRPPDWLIDTVELDVRLDPTATRVRTVMALRPNPPAAAPPRGTLDGEALKLAGISLNGAPLAADQYVATPDGLTIPQPPAGPFKLAIETELDPSANTRLMGLYKSGATYCTQCEAEG